MMDLFILVEQIKLMILHINEIGENICFLAAIL